MTELGHLLVWFFFFLILNLGITNTWCSVGHTKGAQKMLDEPL